MNEHRRQYVGRLPSGALVSALMGLSAAAVGWWALALLPGITSSYVRLDQWSALVLGGAIGAAVTGSRERRQRRRVAPGVAAGAILGGVGALTGASLIAFAHAAIGPGAFLLERAATWGLLSAGCTALIGAFVVGYRGAILAESVAIAGFGGAVGGVVFSLPGAADAWQAAAMLWTGGAIGIAVAGPELWHAVAVIELLPPRDGHWQPLRVREWPLGNGVALMVGEAQVACADGRVAFYPPAGGALAEGHAIRAPRFIGESVVITVGRSRYLVQVLRPCG